MDLRPLTLHDSDALPTRQAWAELLALSFDRTAEDMCKLLDWLHAGFPVVAWGMWDGERLAAQYACLRVNITLPGALTPVHVGMSLNMSVHPDYRGQGLIKQVSHPVYEAIMAGGGIAGMGFSNAEGVKVDKKSKGYGYQVIGRMIPAIAWIPPRHISNTLPLSDTWQDLTFTPHPPNGHIAFAATVDAIHHRYAQHPFRRYRYGVDASGVVVYRPSTVRGVRGVSLLAAYSGGASLTDLLKRWGAALRVQGVQWVHVLTSPDSALRHALEEAMICRTLPLTRSPYYLTVKPFRETTPPAMLNFNTWDIMGGDVL